MNTRLILRPVREKDLEAIADMAARIVGGMTSLPPNREHLHNQILDSLRAFDPRIRKAGGERYLFVLENVDTGQIAGTSGLLSRVGGFDAFYTYRVCRHERHYGPLHIHQRLSSLQLIRNHKGPTEICSLFLDPAWRGSGVGRLLSLSRFCFIKAFPERFDHEIIAELRGFQNTDGRSPFWEAVGHTFFQKDFNTADFLTGIGEKDFLEALSPEFPIYIDLLPENVQAVIGRVHPQTEPAWRILKAEGFQQTDEVDIFDAGPLVRARRDQLHSWQATRRGKARLSENLPETAGEHLVTSVSLNYRAVLAPLGMDADQGPLISRETAEQLEIQEGEDIQWLPTRN